MLKIFIVGGYGRFGGRLVDLLLDNPSLTLIVAGRNLISAQNFCSERNGQAKLVPLQFNRSAPETALADIKPDVVVDASGPFQVYGEDPYKLPRLCIEAGICYIDLADGADFVHGIAQLDQAAKAKGVFALSGMSSFPVLTTAVCVELSKQLDRIDSIEAGIAPSPYAGVGLNVVKAIASYAGKPVSVLQNGKWVDRAGFFDSRRLQVRVPGTVPLAPIRFGLCEVPDLKVLAQAFPTATSVWMGAGPTPAPLHRVLWICAGLVKRGLLPSLLPFAPIMNVVINTVRWGEHRGGLVLEIAGQKNGQTKNLSWHLLAEGDGGPMIPSMAAAAIITKLTNADVIAFGARSGRFDLTLADYQHWFERYSIRTGTRDDSATAPLYKKLLGEAFSKLDPAVQQFHAASQSFHMKGEAKVTAPANPLAVLVRKLFGFPSSAPRAPIEVDIAVSPTHELWQRHFAGKLMQSLQREGKGRDAGLVVEEFGPFHFAMAVVEEGGTLRLILRKWKFLRLPMPRLLMPHGAFSEHGKDGRFHFSVDIQLPLLGRVVCYEGWLSPA